jgi:hypothetical protein
MTLNRVQHGNGIGQPRAYPAGDQSLDVSGRKPLASLRCLFASGQ